MRFKKWIPGVMLGAMMTAMTSVSVMASNINPGSTHPGQNLRGLVVPVWTTILEMTVGRYMILRIQKLPVWLLSQRIGMIVWQMFINCKQLTELICPFDTSKVTDMYGMFSMLSKLTSLDLSTFNTSKVKDMGNMFEDSYNLTRLKLGAKFAFVGSNYRLPSGTWYASDGTVYTSDGKSCNIPQNKSDTYTRK